MCISGHAAYGMITTPSGRIVDLARPDPAAWPLRDVGAALAVAAASPGGGTGAYSLAQRACLAHDLAAPDARAAALLWDAPAALGIGGPPGFLSDEGTRLVGAWRAAVLAAAGYTRPLPRDLARSVAAARARVLVTEARDLLPATLAPPASPTAPPFSMTAQPLPARIRPWPWHQAWERWAERLDDAVALAA